MCAATLRTKHYIELLVCSLFFVAEADNDFFLMVFNQQNQQDESSRSEAGHRNTKRSRKHSHTSQNEMLEASDQF
jgi:hypothetical protein